MKKLTTTITAATVAILLLFTGCDKYHRDRYTGTWDFVTEKYKYIPDATGHLTKKEYDTTFYYSGKITNDERYDNRLIIMYTETDEINVGIDEDGYIYPQCPLSYGSKFSTGKFANKNQMNLIFDWEEYTPLGNGEYYGVGEYFEMQGTKTSKKQ